MTISNGRISSFKLPTALTEMIRALDGASVKIADLALRRPTLDDVFMALTGHAAEQDGGGNGDEPVGRRGGTP